MELLVVGAFAVVIFVVPWLMAPRPADAPDDGDPTVSGAGAAGGVFSSPRERRLWLYALAVIVAIYSTLSPAQGLAATLRERGLLGVASGAALLAVAGVLAVLWVRSRPGRIEFGAGLGVAAVYLTTVIRLPVIEARSHLFEYGLLALLIHQALTERRLRGRRTPPPPLAALGAAAAIGWIDEGVQALVPNRVYDLVDVGMNAAFALMAIVAVEFLGWARGWDLRRRRGASTPAPRD